MNEATRSLTRADCYFLAFDHSDMPGDVMAVAPLIGEHDAFVFQEFLGMTEKQSVDYKMQGAFA